MKPVIATTTALLLMSGALWAQNDGGNIPDPPASSLPPEVVEALENAEEVVRIAVFATTLTKEATNRAQRFLKEKAEALEDKLPGGLKRLVAHGVILGADLLRNGVDWNLVVSLVYYLGEAYRLYYCPNCASPPDNTLE